VKNFSINDLKVRCSGIGNVIAKATGKRTISAGAETFVKTWLVEKLTGKRTANVSTPAMQKGTFMEDDAFDFLCELDKGMYLKNETGRLENDYLTGEYDCLDGDTVIDIKCPKDAFSMPYFDTTPDKGYWCQLQGYMALTGAKKARLIYLLMDYPEHMIEQAQRRASWNNEDIEAVRKSMTFEDVPNEYRKKEFRFERDDEFIASLYNRIELMREYGKDLLSNM
jgi:hypothetical protein